MKVCYALLGNFVLGAAVPRTQPDAHDVEWVEAPRRLLEQMKAGHLHHFHPHPQHKRASLLAEHTEAPKFVAAKHAAATMTPNVHDAEWVEAPRHVLEEMKAGHLRHGHIQPQHRRASLLAENAAVSEGTMTGKILGDIGTAEHALEHALRGAPGILEKEEGLLKQASFMATQAGHFQAQERSLTHQMNMHAAQRFSKSEKHMSKAESNAMLKDVGRKETALIADGFGILRETKNLKVDVVDAIGESNPMMAAKVEHLLDSVGIDQKKIMRGEARLAHGVKQSLMGERAHLRHKTRSSFEGLAQAARDEEKLAHGGASVLKSAETIKGEVSHLLGSEQASEVSHLMDQVEHIQHRVNVEDHESSVDDLRLLKQQYQAQASASSHHPHKRSALAQRSTEATDTALLSKFAREERSLKSLANRRQGMVRQTRHVLAETGRAQAAIEEKLGGTETGNQIAELLEKAQAAERQAATGSQKEAKLAFEDVHSMQALEHIFKRAGRVHV